MTTRPACARLRSALLGLLRDHRSGLFMLAIAVGLASGAGAVLFRLGIDAWTRFLTGAQDYTLSLGPSTGALSGLGRWFLVVAPVLSGIMIGPLMMRWGRAPTGHGVSGVLWSSRLSDGAMAPGPAAATVVSAALTIGGGGSVGPEGPIAELGASATSLFSRRLGLPRRAVRLLAAAGTAAGIAAAFNAPLAGAFFAMEVVLIDFTVDAFAFVVLACVSSTVLSHHLLGVSLSLSLPSLNLTGDTQLGWVALLGILGGLIGVGFSRARYLSADAATAGADRLRLPHWARPALGGLLVGGVLLVVPETYGESSAILGRALDGRYTALALAGLLLAKIIATAVTLAVGMPGGLLDGQRAVLEARGRRGLRGRGDGGRVLRRRPCADYQRCPHHRDDGAVQPADSPHARRCPVHRHGALPHPLDHLHRGAAAPRPEHRGSPGADLRRRPLPGALATVAPFLEPGRRCDFTGQRVRSIIGIER